MGGLAWWHWLLIIAAFVLLFGAKKLPDAARGVGRSLRILKAEVSAMHEDDPKKPAAGETDVTATVPTPSAQVAPTPVLPVVQQPVVQQPVVQQPTPVAVQQPTPVAVQQPIAVPAEQQRAS